MQIIRSLIVLIEMIIFAVGALIIGLIIIPSSGFKYKGTERRKYCANVIHKSWDFFTNVMTNFGTLQVEKTGDFKNIKGKVIVASHPSLIDIVLLIGLIPNSLCLAKKALLKNPIMHHIVKNLYILNDIDIEEFQTETKNALNEGFNIIIFPTGTRTLPNEEIKIHKGAAQIAINANTDIIPITIEQSFPLLIKNHFPLNAGSEKIIYKIKQKNDIKISEYKKENLSDIKLRKLISEKIKEEIIITN